jgi:hypothetical protein
MTLSAIEKLRRAASLPGQAKLDANAFPKPVREAREWLEKNKRILDGPGIAALPKDLANKLASNMRTDGQSTQSCQATYKDN